MALVLAGAFGPGSSTRVCRIWRPGSGFSGCEDGPSPVPSMMMAVPQCLQVMRARLPRTRSSGTAYFAGQAVQATFMKLFAGDQNLSEQRWR
jgi:hypothetical protein